MSISLFHIIDDGVAVLRVRGRVFKQTKIYSRGEHVYAQASGGFIRLTTGGNTTDPNISWLEVEGPGVSFKGNRTPVFGAETVAKAA